MRRIFDKAEEYRFHMPDAVICYDRDEAEKHAREFYDAEYEKASGKSSITQEGN